MYTRASSSSTSIYSNHFKITIYSKNKTMAKTTLLTLKLLTSSFDIYRLPAKSPLPQQIFTVDYYFIGKTKEELSLVVPQTITIKSDKVEKDWQALMIVGPLDFSLTGILSKIASKLAEENISIFALSTFDTDFILVKSDKITRAIEVLQNNHYKIIKE